MKRLTTLFTALCLGGLVSVATAGDYHSGSTLVCTECHTAHWSISPGHDAGFHPELIGGAAPHEYLLLNETNELCLSCHNENSIAPDVFGANHGKYSGTLRMGGGLNSVAGSPTTDGAYPETGGHTMWSTQVAPGGTWVAPTSAGLECTHCHAQHGQRPFQYRNLQQFVSADTLDYAATTNNPNKAVYLRNGTLKYAEGDVDFNEPHTWSDYAKWCGNCHTNFHGTSADANMHGTAWKRHPVADANVGAAGGGGSQLSRWTGRANRVKVMDKDAHWDATSTDITPSCFSCHKGHGNKNPFALIYLTGNPLPVGGVLTEEGDGGQYKNLCRQCHRQGADL